MTDPVHRPGAARPGSAFGRILLVAAALALLAVAAAGAWYLFLRPPAPEAVSLGSTPTTQPTTAATGLESADPTTFGSGSAPSAGSGGNGDGIEGSWQVDPSIGSFDDFSGSFVGYRVQEELAGIGAATAVGRTPDVTGALTVEGTTITAAEFEADLTTLRSDSSMRDGQLGRQGLETDRFPTATFVLTEPIDLGTVPADGEAVTATAVGDLTLHGATRSVEIPLEARLSGGVISVVGSLPIAFGDYGMTAPESMRVLSIDENGMMELQLQLTKA